MADELKVWALGGGADVAVVESVTIELEERLEEALVRRPEMLEPGLHLVGHQTPTESGPLDLLGVDEGGRLVVCELKRERLTREAVTQCIDYASALNVRTPEQIAELISEHSSGRGIEEIDDFEEWYMERFEGNDLADLLPPRLLLVGLGVDTRAERMARFLSERGVDMSVLTFFGFRHRDETLLARQVEVERDGTAPPARPSGQSAAEKRQALQRRLAERGMTDLFDEIAGTLRSVLPESSQNTGAWGISFNLPFGAGRRRFCHLWVEEDVGARVQWYAIPEHYEADALDALAQEGERLGWLPVRGGLSLNIAGDERWRQVHEGLTRFVATALESWNTAPQVGVGEFRERVWSYLRDVPPGTVVTYKQVAEQAGSPDAAQAVGSIMRALRDDTDVPWHRVVNAQGRLATAESREQRERLGEEGIDVGEDGSVDLEQHRWRG
ncbi:MAG: DUF91 domain-containing protein [Acidobacteria bacterium]|nr:DUF91 domain-containing protein [Acidobacteriota bacterium]